MTTQRLKLLISYRGTRYHGWQQQAVLPNYKGPPIPPGQGLPTIQETMATVIGKLVGHPITIVASSRTDAGVHAKAQIAHLDTSLTQAPSDGLRRAINHRLPDDILIREIVPVPDTFDSIMAAVSKRYQYFIWNTADRNPFHPDLCWHRWQPLDVPAMIEASQHFVGQHDFTSFSKPGHGRDSTIRTIHSCTVTHRGPKIVIGVEGNGFLWHMVRIIAGTLVEIGLGQYTPDDIPKMIQATDRRRAAKQPRHTAYSSNG